MMCVCVFVRDHCLTSSGDKVKSSASSTSVRTAERGMCTSALCRDSIPNAAHLLALLLSEASLLAARSLPGMFSVAVSSRPGPILTWPMKLLSLAQGLHIELFPMPWTKPHRQEP
ncbi:unnamed protein product [Symbiodinium natans]|uniref:Uncharacterized protein n=1 Tax=Symbiodinium natans TaxID=878477 RepID=A0A812JX06_9DINO|nr:unnamed protein product [Symbiodinium natans]